MNITKPVTLVLLRGLGRDHRHWGAFIPLLQSRFPGARLICPDMPGNGELYRERSPMHVNRYVDSLREQLAEKGFDGPVHIIALSLGAMVALEWQHRYPGECASLTLINSSFSGLSPFYRRLSPANYLVLLRLLVSDLALKERTILKLTSNHHADDQALLEDWMTFASTRPVRRSNLLRQLIMARRYALPPTRPCRPVLVVASEKDRLVNSRCSRDLAGFWHLPLALHSSAGHDLSLDDGEWLCQQLADWFEALNNGANEGL